MSDFVAELLSAESGDLFSKAREISQQKGIKLCSPNIITGACKTEPTCRHCKWEHLKTKTTNFTGLRNKEEIASRAAELKDWGVHRMFMPSGWQGYTVPDYFCEYITIAKEVFGQEVYGLFGAIDRKSLSALKEAGMHGYLCGLESPNQDVYKKFRPGGDSLGDRIQTLADAKDLGLKVWSGFLVGFGETNEDIIRGLKILIDLDVDSLSILPFTPFPNTGMDQCNPANPFEWARIMAAARILMKRADVFSDHTDGFMGEYGRLGGANGFYFFPGKRLENKI